MNPENYIRMLESAIIERGISKEKAARHVKLLSLSLSENDLTDLSSEDICKEISELADSISIILKRQNSSYPASFSSDASGQNMDENTADTEAVSDIPLTGQNIFYKSPTECEEISPDAATVKALSASVGKIILHAFLYLLLGILGIFSALFLFLLTIAGTMLFIVDIVYAVTQMFSFPASGVFEIGLAIVIIGICIAVGVMLYNVPKTYIPKVQRKIIQNIKYLEKKASKILNLLRQRRRKT